MTCVLLAAGDRRTVCGLGDDSSRSLAAAPGSGINKGAPSGTAPRRKAAPQGVKSFSLATRRASTPNRRAACCWLSPRLAAAHLRPEASSTSTSPFRKAALSASASTSGGATLIAWPGQPLLLLIMSSGSGKHVRAGSFVSFRTETKEGTAMASATNRAARSVRRSSGNSGSGCGSGSGTWRVTGASPDCDLR